MNILLIGSGGREHAMAWKMSKSPLLKKLYILPGNAGTALLGENLPLNPLDFEKVASSIEEKNIDILVIGPEEPLVKGLHEFLSQQNHFKNLTIIGPESKGAALEGSKDFAKAFMLRHNIPTAKYRTFGMHEFHKGREFLKTLAPPYVLKADGLAAGKGVLIINEYEEACDSLATMLKGQFGEASSKVVIEEFLSGIELSVFVLTDGTNYKLFPEAKDYKRIGEGDTGLNTGGMGAVSPVSFADADFMRKVENKIIVPTIEGLKKEDIPFVGFIFFGLISVKKEPVVIEYNVRLGDPETEAIMLRLQDDLVQYFVDIRNKNFNSLPASIDKEYATTIMLVSGGYPGNYQKGYPINGHDLINESVVFHAGTAFDEDSNIITSGGRVMAISSKGATMNEALTKSYHNAKKITFIGKYFRPDIGFDLKS